MVDEVTRIWGNSLLGWNILRRVESARRVKMSTRPAYLGGGVPEDARR